MGGCVVRHVLLFCMTGMPYICGESGAVPGTVLIMMFRGSRNSVGIAIQLSDSEEEKLFVHDSMQVSPE